jgi:antirestriction protein ArdC
LTPQGQVQSSEDYGAEDYGATALLKLTHWSGHKSRLAHVLKGYYRCAG